MGGFEELLQGDLKANCKSFLNCKGIVEIRGWGKGEKTVHKKPPQQNLVYLWNKTGDAGIQKNKKA